MGQREFVPTRTKADDRTDGLVGKIGVMAKGFARMYVGQVHFDERDGDTRQRIAQRHTGVRQRTGIDHDEGNALGAGSMYPIDQRTLMIALKSRDEDTRRFALRDQTGIDVRQRVVTIDCGFPDAEQIEVGSVEHQNRISGPGLGRRRGRYLAYD